MIGAENIAGSNHKTAAAWNRGLALRLLRKHGTLSRRQISQMTGLRGSTLTYIVRELLQKNVVRVAGKLNSTGVGQKQVLLRVNPGLGWVLGMSLRPHNAQLTMLDAAGGVIGATQFEIGGPLEKVPRQVRIGFDQWMQRVGRPVGRLLGIGAAAPGTIDADKGVVLRSPLFHAESVPLARLLKEQFEGADTIVDHNARLGALCEAVEGAGKDASHFLYFLINQNVNEDGQRSESFGAALYLGNCVYRGAHFAAAEMDPRLAPQPPVMLSDADRATLADPAARVTTTLLQLATTLGPSLASIVNLIDIGLIVLGGNKPVINRQFIDALQAEVAKTLLPIPGRTLRISPTKVPGDAVSRGAAMAASEAAVDGGDYLCSPEGAAEPAAAPSQAVVD